MSDEIKKGLLGIVVDETTVSQVMPDINSLTYRGYAVQDLCEKCIFEEVAYLVSDQVESYCTRYTHQESPLLKELASETHKKMSMPQMMSSHLSGSLLAMLAKMIAAKTVVEVGMFTGYASLSLAEALAEDGIVYALELSQEYSDFAKNYFAKSPHGKKIKVLLGPALDSLTKISEKIDMAFIDADKQNYIVQIPGANHSAGLGDISHSLEVLRNSDVLMLQREVSQDVSLLLAEEAWKNDVKVIWDPAPAPQSRDSTLLELMKLADVVTPNETEAEALTGIEVTDFSSAEHAAREISALGPQAVIITMGGQGGLVLTNNDMFTFEPLDVETVDTVAAGDAFAAGLSVAIGEGQSIRESVEFGRVSGGLAVTAEGAMISMPTREQVLEQIEK